ncbi:polysaccharide deacetylase family protein [Bacteroides caecigallinarum]|uniref:polysaccharide deacetylase family protein n=1 Tax=Bacteroides TaxID=816 RepID=UPI00082139BC|nr:MULTISPECIES: polysaccharide deacetylase family protein [Bacteroides]MBM6960160.1 polysaccharide deacetylase family protein [Bacteroides caecigallinarum]MCF2737392.1 polysaccharide deacetylase family protein [Bacteroides caecigallinarum]MCR8895272.1 polysaccharide deacetylase family protein [Bacteroides sp. ET336]MCU6772826.1 polysaccharide deacetylase family protein [Bacteroides cellulolyticus]MDN0059768.1 polysaccharide deacetylase family protein [Bacteroides caecigallinarum]
MFIEQPPQLIRCLYPSAIWRMDKDKKAVYLTFDDGPIPRVTPWVLDVLDRYGIKATFFMVGDNIRKHPDEFRMVVERGHRIGNHTFNHIRGLSYDINSYLENTDKACRMMMNTNLFRPPHGYMSPKQYAELKKRYKIIMWDLVTRDYNRKFTGEQILQKVKKYARNGSIITFHDSLKSEENIRYALPKAIEWLMEQGYEFKVFE